MYIFFILPFIRPVLNLQREARILTLISFCGDTRSSLAVSYTQHMTDTAVLLLGYKRTENIAKRLWELSRTIDTPIIISIDGGLTSFEKEEILRVVKAFEESNLMMIKRLVFRPINLGLVKHINLAISEVLDEFEFCIVIEDDVSISRNFVGNLKNARHLFKRKDVLTIGGFSPFIPYVRFRLSRNLLRESKYFSAWGWMISREKWGEYEPQIPFNEIMANLSSSPTWTKMNETQRKIWLRRFKKVANSNPSTWDYQMQYLSIKNGWVNILPTYKICENLGFDDLRSTHTLGRRPKWMKKQNGFPNETLNNKELITINSLRGKVLNQFDSIFIAGDSRITKASNSIKSSAKYIMKTHR